MKRYLALLLLTLLCGVSFARVDLHHFDSDEKTARYKQLTQELRCLVCQNQNIADSNADLAEDLKQQIFEMIQADKTDDEIVQYMVDRYGDFVLYRPPLKPMTWLLWGGPFLLVIIGFITVATFIRRRGVVEAVSMSDAERQRVNDLLKSQETEKEDRD